MDYAAYATVILDHAVDKPLEYGVLTDQLEKAKPGSRVEVLVRGSPRQGMLLKLQAKCTYPAIRPLSKILSEDSLLTQELLELCLWTSTYYCSPLRDIFKMVLPPSIRKGMKEKEQLFVMRGRPREILRSHCIAIREKKPSQASILEAILPIKKGILLTKLLEKANASRSSLDSLVQEGFLLIETVKIDRSPLVGEEYFKTKPKALNGEQKEALAKIEASLLSGAYQTHLLHGVTGSGKTEVYLQSIDFCLKQKKSALLLVPEISLTAQTIERFRSRFDEKIAILHHRLSEGERRDEWMKVRSGKANIVIGARSAIFSPVQNLGLIIVDEEHEQSYKQSECSPCYQARDVAVMRGRLAKATVILGSATPSLESYYNAACGKYLLSTLQKRASASLLPQVTIVDMKKEYDKAKGITNFSETLLNGIEKRLEKGEQAILFLNRRGYHTTLYCQSCSAAIKCLHCDTSLTFHLGDNQLACHLCGYQLSPPPKCCPSCKTLAPLKFRGAGTEQIERALHAIFPKVRTLRIDADTTKHKGSLQTLLRQFSGGKADVLIGTQMIAKGLHFPEVTLVGVLNSDGGLQIPDFRASEQVFQLITQVAGRSGRGTLMGEVIIQTSIPEHSTIQHASRQDYEAFYQEEIAVRKMFHYPPFTHMAKFSFSGKEAKATEMAARRFHEILASCLPNLFLFHPVVPSGHAKVKDRFRFQFLLRGPSMSAIQAALKQLQASFTLPRSIKLSIDINPSSTFF